VFHLLEQAGFDISTRNHAGAIPAVDLAEAIKGLVSTLPASLAAVDTFRLSVRDLIHSGGGQAASTMRLRDALCAR
jgi:hypothetical protein